MMLSLVFKGHTLRQQYNVVHLEIMDGGGSKLAPISQRGMVRERSQAKLSNRKSALRENLRASERTILLRPKGKFREGH